MRGPRRNPTPPLMVLAATAVGSLVTGAAFLLGSRSAARPARATERRLDRAWAVLEADRARMLNLLLARTPTELAMLASSSPAHPPAPDPDLGMPAALTGRPDLLDDEPEYVGDPNEMDSLDDAALHLARR